MGALSDFIHVYFPVLQQYSPSDPNPQFYAHCTISSNQTNGIVCYAEGDLDYTPPHTTYIWNGYFYYPLEVPGRYKGTIKQYFSDRRGAHDQRFLVDGFDPAELTIEARVSTNVITGSFKLMDGSVSSIRITGTDAGVLYGTSYGVGGYHDGALWTFSFSPVYPITG